MFQMLQKMGWVSPLDSRPHWIESSRRAPRSHLNRYLNHTRKNPHLDIQKLVFFKGNYQCWPPYWDLKLNLEPEPSIEMPFRLNLTLAFAIFHFLEISVLWDICLERIVNVWHIGGVNQPSDPKWEQGRGPGLRIRIRSVSFRACS